MRMIQTIYSTWLSQSSVVQELTDNQGQAITWFKPEMIYPEINKLWTGLLITEFPAPGKWMGPKKVSDWMRKKSQFVLLVWLKDPLKGMWTFPTSVLKSLLQHESSPVSLQCSWCPVLLGHCPMGQVSQPPTPPPPPALVMACLDGQQYLYSRSCRISTGSRPCGFWMGLIRLCFCCSCRTGEGCPGAGCCTEGPGTAVAVGWAAAGGAGEGRPLGAGADSFCEVLWPLSSRSCPGPVRQEGHGRTG